MNEAELLFSRVLDCDRISLYLDKKRKLNKPQSRFIASVLERRIKGEPLQYILGETEFMGLKFKLDPGALIPRPETEILVEKIIQAANSQNRNAANMKILDLGTGSGCIAVSLAKFLPEAKIFASDLSPKALAVAKQNASLNKVKVEFLLSDLFDNPKMRLEPFDLIASNPPYVEKGQINKLQPELRFEPLISLNGGKDGLNFYRRIIKQAAGRLKKKGLLIFEIGFNQRSRVENIFQKSKNFKIIEVIRDYNKIDRIITAKRN